MKNRLPKPVIVTAATLEKDFDRQIEGAQDTDRVRIEVQTTRQASTQDAFRLTPVNDGPDELAIGWKGLAKFFMSLDAADSVCYLTAMRMNLYPDNPEKWQTVAKNWVVLRMPTIDGGQVVQDILPDAPVRPPVTSGLVMKDRQLHVPVTHPRQLEEHLKSVLGVN